MKRRFVTEGVLRLMRRLEAEGKSRREISELTGLVPATVTKHLGATRRYGWRRSETTISSAFSEKKPNI